MLGMTTYLILIIFQMRKYSSVYRYTIKLEVFQSPALKFRTVVLS